MFLFYVCLCADTQTSINLEDVPITSFQAKIFAVLLGNVGLLFLWHGSAALTVDGHCVPRHESSIVSKQAYFLLAFFCSCYGYSGH